MKQINLYQAAFHPPRVIMPARRLLMGGVFFLCGMLALYAWDAWRLTQLRQEVGRLTQRAANLDAQVNAGAAARQADPRLLAEAEAVETRLHNLQLARAALADGSLGSDRGYSAQFRALSRARVNGAWLTHIEVGDGGKAMSLRGRALTGEDSARLIASLQREPLFVGLSYSGLTLTQPEDAEKEADGAAPRPPRFLEFSLTAWQAAPSDVSLPPTPAGAMAVDPAALAAALAAGKLDANQAAQAAAVARNAP